MDLKTLCLAPILFTLFAHCGEGRSSALAGNNAAQTPVIDNSIVFSAACRKNTTAGTMLEGMEFNKDLKELARIIVYYADSHCQKPAYEIREIINYRVTHIKPLEEGMQANYEGTIHAILWTAHSQETVADYNRIKYCGVTGWKIYTRTDITGKTCATKHYPEAGSTKYDIAKYQHDALTFGATPSYGSNRDLPKVFAPEVFHWVHGAKENPFD